MGMQRPFWHKSSEILLLLALRCLDSLCKSLSAYEFDEDASDGSCRYKSSSSVRVGVEDVTISSEPHLITSPKHVQLSGHGKEEEDEEEEEEEEREEEEDDVTGWPRWLEVFEKTMTDETACAWVADASSTGDVSEQANDKLQALIQRKK